MWSFFLQNQRLSGSLQNSCSKELFGKFPGGPANALKHNSTLDGLQKSMQSMQKFLEQLFFRTIDGRVLPKVQIAFFESNNERL